MHSKVIIQIAVIVLVTSLLGACDQASRDVGADMAACNLEEMKTNYPAKARVLQNPVPTDSAKSQTRINELDFHRRKFLIWCMRARGWHIPNEGTKLSAKCFLENFSNATCYKRANALAE